MQIGGDSGYQGIRVVKHPRKPKNGNRPPGIVVVDGITPFKKKEEKIKEEENEGRNKKS
jgi:hypothetical protein